MEQGHNSLPFYGKKDRGRGAVKCQVWSQWYAAAAYSESKGSIAHYLLALLGMLDVGVSYSFCNDNRLGEDFYY